MNIVIQEDMKIFTNRITDLRDRTFGVIQRLQRVPYTCNAYGHSRFWRNGGDIFYLIVGCIYKK